VVADDAGYGDNTISRLGLAARGFDYVLAVTGTTSTRWRIEHDTAN
jgi:hypothetical protein